MEFSKRLKLARKNKNLTQEELAKQIHVSRSLVARWEYGDVYPSVSYLDLLSKVLEVSIDELIDNEEKLNVIKKQDIKIRKIDRKIKTILYIGVTIFSLLTSILYFCKIYRFVGYDYSSGIKIEKVFYYYPIEGIGAECLWLVSLSIILNITLIVVLNIFTFRKNDLAPKLFKIILMILVISVIISALVFVIGALNPPKLK